MRNRFYTIATKDGVWVEFGERIGGGKSSYEMTDVNVSDLLHPAIFFTEESLTDWLEQAQDWAKEATEFLGVPCVVVPIDLTRPK